jgi:hypothetical protein
MSERVIAHRAAVVGVCSRRPAGGPVSCQAVDPAPHCVPLPDDRLSQFWGNGSCQQQVRQWQSTWLANQRALLEVWRRAAVTTGYRESRTAPKQRGANQRFLRIASSVADVVSALVRLSARFSLSDLPAFLDMFDLGDLSDIASPLIGGLYGPDPQTIRPSQGCQRPRAWKSFWAKRFEPLALAPTPGPPRAHPQA